jgi:hypothetical protein
MPGYTFKRYLVKFFFQVNEQDSFCSVRGNGKTKTNHFLRLVYVILIYTLLLSHTLFSQQNLGRQTIVQFDANHHVLKPDAPYLARSIPMAEGVRSGKFLGAHGVGGISFDQLAFPAKDLIIRNIAIKYDRNSEDGYRIKLSINDNQVHLFLPDWLLIPIAKYAQSPYYSCVTLFGILHDKALEKLVVESKGRVINYHPSFDNTLLGIRLAYMDMLIGYPYATDLPKNNLGKYILGRGESVPDLEANRLGAYNLSQHIIQIENKYKLTFRSYVITDYTQLIDFDVVNDSLAISGIPYFFCWKYKSDNANYDFSKIVREDSAKFNQQLEEILRTPGKVTTQDWIIDKLISQIKRYKDNYSFYSEGTFIDAMNLRNDDERRQFLKKFEPSSLFDLIVNTEARFDSYSILNLEKFSKDISSRPELFKATNPAVWNATLNTMKFAAFFRYLKVQYPEIWRAFYNELRLVEPEPGIITPTIMYDPSNELIKNAIRKFNS